MNSAVFAGLLLAGLLFPLSGCRKEAAPAAISKQEARLTGFAAVESLYLAHLHRAILALDTLGLALNDSGDTVNATQRNTHFIPLFIIAKSHYKALEPVLAYTDRENAKFLNGPNLPRVDEEDATNIRILEPSGYQVLEELIQEDFTPEIKAEIVEHIRQTKNRLRLLQANTRFKDYDDYHFLWLLREALLRISFINLSGFDSPALENTLPEARQVYASLGEMLTAGYASRFRDTTLYRDWLKSFASAQTELAGGREDFAAFDRFAFMQKTLHRQIALWNRTVEDWQVTFPIETALRNRFVSPFSKEAFNMAYFADPQLPPDKPEKQSLGRALFHDTRLASPGRKMSCATCHIETQGFADQRKTAAGLPRNTPTITYAALQRDFFFDGRAGSLEGQIVSVVESELEFHTNLKDMADAIRADSTYRTRFAAIYRDTITEANIRNVIADYVRSLIPFNSRFDRAMRSENQTPGSADTLTPTEIRGFNLFMGKAKCATCHFPPTFNGTLPPDYTDTEFEHLGVPAEASALRPRAPGSKPPAISPDLGRFHYLGTKQRKHFFKTPTVRNAALTFPYMHNGVFNTLEEVIDFYDAGGGIGLGMSGPEVEFQTLPADSLGLNADEKAALIAFMKALSDKVP